MLLDVAREWLDLEGDFELESSMGADLGVLGEGCASMGVILVVEWTNERNSGGEGLNEEEGDASRLKSTQIDPNAPEMNVCEISNVAQKDEGERARGQASRPPLGWPAPPCQVWLRDSGVFLLGLSIFGQLGALVQKGKESRGERKRDTKPRIRPV